MVIVLNNNPSLPEFRDGFKFRGGHVALDFTATLVGRNRPVSTDLLDVPGDLSRWLVASGMAQKPAPANQAMLVEARQLRAAIFESASAVVAGVNLSENDLTDSRIFLNRLAAGHSAFPQIDDDGRAYLQGDVPAYLSFIAGQAIMLFSDMGANRIRQCESEKCTIFFIDQSRARDRRWCSMSACGNRAKIAEFRKRKKAEKTPVNLITG